MRKARWLLAVPATVVVGLSAFWLINLWNDNEKGPPPLIPKPEQVERLLVRLEGGTFGLPVAPPFELPEKHMAAVLRCLTPTKFTRHPTNTAPVGWLELTLDDGRTVNIQMLSWGQAPLKFVVDGWQAEREGPYEPPYGENGLDEGMAFYAMLEGIHQELMGRAPPGRVAETFSLLEWSAGRRPPAPARKK